MLHIFCHGFQRQLKFRHVQLLGRAATGHFGAAPGRQFLEVEFLGLDSRQPLHPFSQCIKAHQLRLHFTHLDRHRRQVFLQVLVLGVRVVDRGDRNKFAQQRQVCARQSQGQRGHRGRAQHDQGEESENGQQYVFGRQRDGFGLGKARMH